MDQEEDDWGGKIEFGCLLFEDECTQAHACAGRLMGVLSHIREKVIGAPNYDPRDIVGLVDKYRDAHISDDSGWRKVDSEEWFVV